MKYKTTIILILLCISELKADYRSEIYSAYINNRMEMWKNVIDRMEVMNGKNNEQILELLNYQYGYIGYCLSLNKKDEGKMYIDFALKNIELLDKAGYKPSMVNAYKSAFYGYRILINKLSSPVNGIKSINHATLSIKLDSENYLGYVQYGNIKFYMPAALGGSKKEALDYFLKAKALFDKNPSEIKGDWNYISLLVLIGQTYYYMEDYSSSKAVYENILNIEPGFKYVKDDLYPKLLEKIGISLNS